MKVSGCYTALVTPFENGKIDYGALYELVESQIKSGIDGLVPAGTTGESPTLSFDEHKKLIKTVIDTVSGRCQVIAGTGGNSTDEASELTRFAKDQGADATLQVTPYYNKPTQEGIYRHFMTIADTIALPVVLYNIPSRTGTEIGIDTIERLSKNSNIVAIKEASGSIDRVSCLIDSCDLQVLSGDDTMTLPMISLGAKGVISVASNVIPKEIRQLTHSALDDDVSQARALHFQYHQLFTALFIETNPIPVKAALAILGKIKEEYRLPLCPMSDTNRKRLVNVLEENGIYRSDDNSS